MCPFVYELNTRCWLRDLSEACGAPVTLGNVPDDQLESWRRAGFTHLWLMGVWASGPRSREVYLRHPHTPAHLREALPDWTKSDVAGSPYAIADYRVPDTLGGETGLAAFREQLHAAGLGLMLDFIPNHLGLDHPWLEQHPEYFVQAPEGAPDTFLQLTASGPRWIAHGKDPYFPAWNDTAQLDHRRVDTRAAVIAQLRSVAARCDAVRCDMSMLLLREVFARNWARFPGQEPVLATEFWAEAIAAARRPGFLFLAEAYWDLELQLQSLGFDFTYDKRVLDFLIERHPAALSAHLRDKGDAFVRRSAHFLENHDEPRIAPRLSFEEHEAAAWLTLALPGMRLLHEGQLTGARTRVPVHLSRRPAPDTDSRIAGVYERLLRVLQDTAVGHGEGRLLRSDPAAPGDATHENLVVIEWAGSGARIDLVVVNLGAVHSRCRVTPASPALVGKKWRITDLLVPGGIDETGASASLALTLPPHGIRLLRCQPADRK